MENIIKEIKIPDDRYFIHQDEEHETQVQIIQNLSKINIFIGENNSGKSRFLRSLIIEKELEFVPYNPNFMAFNKSLIELKSELFEYSQKKPKFQELNKVVELSEGFEEIEFLINDEDPLNILSEINKIIESLKRRGGASIGNIPLSTIGNNLESILKDVFDRFPPMNLKYKFRKIYIPILRGLRPFNNEDVYNSRTENDYFSPKAVGDVKNAGDKVDHNRETFTGLQVYDLIKIFLLGRLDQRNLIQEFQDFLSERFFENDEVTLIPDLNEDGILRIKVGEEKEKEIYNLGDGIQSIIIMTFPLFYYKNRTDLEDQNMLFFIEEPEHLLHPGLQRRLMDTFHDERFKNYQFFVTTHSNHFLDITLDYDDVSIYYLRKELDEGEEIEKTPYFSIEPLSYGNINVLELLGVRNTSVFYLTVLFGLKE